MTRSGRLLGALLLAAAALPAAPERSEDIPFVRTVIAPAGPPCPCGMALGDLDGDGRPDAVVAGSDGPLVGYVYPDWSESVITDQGYATQGGLAVGDFDRDGDLDLTVGTDWFENPRLLVFAKTAGFRHSSIEPGIAAIRGLGAANGFAVDATEDAGQFTAANLGRYRAVVFLSTTGDVLDEPQQAAFMAYIRNGGGFVGVHAAADTEYGWPWYGELLGACFARHPAPAQA